MRVLVTCGSRNGGTWGLADAVAEGLTAAGHAVDVIHPSRVDTLSRWDAVVVGGALYANLWARDAIRFLARHADELAHLPVYLFSSGPLDDSSARTDIPPTRQLRRWMERIHPVAHVTFGGVLGPEAKGFIARAMVRNGHGGDFRDLPRVRQWGEQVGEELDAAPVRPRPAPVPDRLRLRTVASLVSLVLGVAATSGGLALVRWPLGPAWAPGLSPRLLDGTGFDTFFRPGLMLLVLVGLLNLLGGALLLRRHRHGEAVAFAGGAAVTIWILAELALVGSPALVHALLFLCGLAVMLASVWLFRPRAAARRAV